ncbi:hypothetical protein [Vibrio maerlii]|uniref:hypothetical protein n=1 Tax=Vibrio maerlii TaxID=2231648 RepID=UPI000E3BABF3|nr:hypothetical protein [Vibrio maerlii]
MNNPKTLIAAFIVACILLYTVLKLFQSESNETVTATVVSQTLTQSLDGHRRYLNIKTSDGEIALLTIPPSQDCPEGSQVKLSKQSYQATDKPTMRFISCHPPVN